MKVNAYNFFFHPLHSKHSDNIKAFSVLTNFILTYLSSGWYLLLFGSIHARECVIANEKTDGDRRAGNIFKKTFGGTKASFDGFIGVDEFRKEHRAKLSQLQRLARSAEKRPSFWKVLQRYSRKSEASDFDCVMFPTSRMSSTHGNKYRMSESVIDELTQSAGFMRRYQEGMILIGKSFGWDLETGDDITDEQQKWNDTSMSRVENMLRSLTEFGCKDLHDALRYFVHEYGIDDKLPSRSKKYLKPLS